MIAYIYITPRIDTEKGLGDIAVLAGLGAEKVATVRKLGEELDKFTASAQHLYKTSSAGIEIKNAVDENARLAQQTTALRERLITLKQALSNDLRSTLSDIYSTTHKQRYMNMIVFFCVLSFSIVMVSIIVNRSIIKPINNILANVSDSAEKVTSASGQVSESSQQMAEGASEELSCQARNMNNMVNVLVNIVQGGQSGV